VCGTRGARHAGDSMEYRQNALRCTELAERAANSQLKAVLKSLAERWLKLADELERVQALREEREPKPNS
jgi:hypothetical protein